ncbi:MULTISPECIES: fibronectin type III domain-containing protein [Streptomycetaceae]|uniref:Fibronectin type-III domain-containing protein n=1 Tax=Streptantibioticus cattleyicolor (strain ATCC 35852 / DSM 46488 / JCM 4925 / NBRC 14057 / NRRL 8057) TaxID=1003195 RepID=F8JT00_STREN|nr:MULTISPECIES: fibronectin type III domain-containing protein [Streptomycetaceae]AEW98082.1 hypothetical protein SCATT_57110 [Streptantibioticus cattleyicolor NRRL 8057 = DSM 46488]MYS62476.1 fibronectin type III domain-containing protein [Streptomyces sp. SID5468]CCB78398.1 protein of unknown function [Streptantibioticus cattleyicolor NRRL 8057 = DSM 46488]
MQATASDSAPAPLRDFTGFEIERREATSDTWSVVLHHAFDPRSASATVCDPLPADGHRYEYRARSYDAAGNYSPYSVTVTASLPVPAPAGPGRISGTTAARER